MTINKLWAMEVFVRIVECGGFARAAESLDLANSTVSSNLGNLEKHLGVTLIHRNTRHLSLTEEGRDYLAKCREILKAVAEAEHEIASDIKDLSGSLRLEAPFAIGQSVLSSALVEFARIHPHIRASVTLTNEPKRLIAHGTDVAIRMSSVEDADLVARPIYKAHYIVCAAPDVVRRANLVDPRDLNPEKCLGIFEDGNYYVNDWEFSKDDATASLTPAGPIHFNSTQAVINAALENAGFIYVLDIFVTDLIRQGRLVGLFQDWKTSSRSFYAVTAKTRFTSPVVRTFIEFLLETFNAAGTSVVRAPVPVRSGRRTRKSH